MNEQVFQEMFTDDGGTGLPAGPGSGTGAADTVRDFPQVVKSRYFANSEDERRRENREYSRQR